jgi:hypothetical protein
MLNEDYRDILHALSARRTKDLAEAEALESIKNSNNGVE